MYTADLPDGAIVAAPDSAGCWLIDGGAMRRWSFGGYGPLEPLPRTAVTLLTAPSIIAALHAGYVPLQIKPLTQSGVIETTRSSMAVA